MLWQFKSLRDDVFLLAVFSDLRGSRRVDGGHKEDKWLTD